MSVQLARTLAEKLVAKLGISKPPVDVRSIADHLCLKIIEINLGPEVSGLLVTKPDQTFVCVHKSDHPVRRRFTIAHEIGHFALRHQFQEGEHVHVDRGNIISRRSPRSSEGVDPKEIEANQFAACLLMPSKMVRRHVEAKGWGGMLLDSQVIALAKEFKVSEQAMTIRLGTLGLL